MKGTVPRRRIGNNRHWAFGPFDTVEEAAAFGETNLDNAQTIGIEDPSDFYRKCELRRNNERDKGK